MSQQFKTGFPYLRYIGYGTRYRQTNQVQMDKPGSDRQTRYRRTNRVQTDKPGTDGQTRFRQTNQVQTDKPGTDRQTRYRRTNRVQTDKPGTGGQTENDMKEKLIRNVKKEPSAVSWDMSVSTKEVMGLLTVPYSVNKEHNNQAPEH
uniref:Uncharacterized protein n=1 Tax=Timema monikensis TaxID=170555 RepID=A0A7R9HR46_9NEOP|nr:unnamed protein product [Timema monikensis]